MNKSVLELEYQVLAAFIIDPATHDFIPKLKEDDFSDGTTKKIFNAVSNLYSNGEEINIITVHEKTQIPISTLSKITELIVSTATIESNIKTLKNYSIRRQLYQKAEAIKQMASDFTLDIDTIKNNAKAEIDNIEGFTSDEVTTLKDAMMETITLIEQRYEKKDDKSYFTGITKLDNAMAGLHPEELTTIAARPGVGKTLFAMQVALKIAFNGKKVMYTTLEMSKTQLCERIIAANTDVDSLRLRLGEIKDDEWERIFKAASYYSQANLLFDKTSITPQDIRSKIRTHKPDLVIIDYLQLLAPSSKQHSREREVASISREIKIMTAEFKIPIIILSQLNRNAEGSRPSLADLRESGAIEQDSDNVIFLHEPNNTEKERLINEGIYTREFFEKLKEKKYTLTQVIIAKQRNGPVGTFELIKVPKLMKFIEIKNE